MCIREFTGLFGDALQTTDLRITQSSRKEKQTVLLPSELMPEEQGWGHDRMFQSPSDSLDEHA